MATNSPGYLRQYFARERAAIIAALGGHCAICGTTETLEIHHPNGFHKPGNGRGSLRRLTDWKRELNNGGELILLCDCCHEQTHKISRKNHV